MKLLPVRLEVVQGLLDGPKPFEEIRAISAALKRLQQLYTRAENHIEKLLAKFPTDGRHRAKMLKLAFSS